MSATIGATMMTMSQGPALQVGPDHAPSRRRRRGAGGITLSDVARIAGVSPITASRALNTPQSVSATALERVRDAVARTGYVPNRIARGLASTRSRLVAAVVPTIAGPVFLPMIKALTEVLDGAGYQLMLGQSGYPPSREDALIDAIIGRRPDGIVLTGVVHSGLARKRLLASGIPVVETWDLTQTPIDMLIGFSHEGAATAVADYLAARGRRRMAVISADDARAARRAQAFSAASRRHVGDDCVRHIVPAPGSLRGGREGFAAVLRRHPDVDSVFCSSDMLALGVLMEAQARGYRVPDDIAVVGFGDLDFAADVHTPLTTVHIDGTAIGRGAARFIIDRLDDTAVPEVAIDIGYRITERASA